MLDLLGWFLLTIVLTWIAARHLPDWWKSVKRRKWISKMMKTTTSSSSSWPAVLPDGITRIEWDDSPLTPDQIKSVVTDPEGFRPPTEEERAMIDPEIRAAEEEADYLAAVEFAESAGGCQFPLCPCSRPCGPAAMANAEALSRQAAAEADRQAGPKET